jgi:hypothetical protein
MFDAIPIGPFQRLYRPQQGESFPNGVEIDLLIWRFGHVLYFQFALVPHSSSAPFKAIAELIRLSKVKLGTMDIAVPADCG